MEVATPIEQLRQNSAKNVISPTTGNIYRIRKISSIDFNRAQIIPILPAADETGASTTETDRSMFLRILDSTQYVLQRGAHIFFGEESDTPEGWIHANWIAGDEGWLSDEVLKFSGLDIESQKKLDSIIKNANGSGHSMPSDANMDDYRAS